MRRWVRSLAPALVGAAAIILTVAAGTATTGSRRATGRESRHVRLRRHAPRPDGEYAKAGVDAHLQEADEGRRHRRQRHGPGLPAEHRASAGTRWRRAPTRPSTARRTTPTSAAATRSRNRTSFSAAGMLQADTIANAAERAGKKVAQIDWVGGAAANINGPTVDFTNFFSNRGVLVGAGRPDRAGRLGVLRRRPTRSRAGRRRGRLERASRPAIRRRRRRRRPGRSRPRSRRRTRTARTTSTSTTASPAAARTTTTRSSARSARPAPRRPIDLKVGDFLPIKLTGANGLIGARAGQTGRPLREADLARAGPEPVQALRHLARARDRQVRHARATACRPAARARTGSRSTSPTTCCRGRPPTSRPRKPASSTRTPTSSRAATSSGPTACR